MTGLVGMEVPGRGEQSEPRHLGASLNYNQKSRPSNGYGEGVGPGLGEIEGCADGVGVGSGLGVGLDSIGLGDVRGPPGLLVVAGAGLAPIGLGLAAGPDGEIQVLVSLGPELGAGTSALAVAGTVPRSQGWMGV